MYQQACRLCGDCVSGCNYAAKNTLIMNYLPDARNHGAEIYTHARVSHVERQDGHWLVHFQLVDAGRDVFDAPPLHVAADVVVLGAGALGSTEILLRSRERGLPLSDRLGERFSGNGDFLAFGYNLDRPVNGIGFGDHDVGELPAVGPCIAGHHRRARAGGPRAGARDRGGRHPRRHLGRAGQGVRDRRRAWSATTPTRASPTSTASGRASSSRSSAGRTAVRCGTRSRSS